MTDFSTPYRVSVPAVRKCEVVLRGERMEEMKVKYLGRVLCKHGSWKKK